MPTVPATTAPAPATAQPQMRQSVTEMSAAQLLRFRDAFRKFVARRDDHGYGYYAGWHGVPLGLCEHNNRKFLPWHRGYLLHFELDLQRIDPGVTLPWWNWIDEGLPAAYTKRRTPEGRTNPLHSAPVRPLGVEPGPDWPKRTERDTGTIPDPSIVAPPFGRAAFDDMMEARSYDDFRERLNGYHGDIHLWVGGVNGQMTDPKWAAFDPIFWAHHTMVDRLWRIWQHRHPGAMSGLTSFMETEMQYPKGPHYKVKDLLDVAHLGYEYSGQSASVPGTI
jgi:tyrosinase